MKKCLICSSESTEIIMDFGEMALAGGFLDESKISSELKYPLRLSYCKVCYTLQIADIVDKSTLFENYFYFSSTIGTLKDHFKELAKEITERFLKETEQSCVLEFGCNDGVLLNPLKENNISKVIGVDPASNVIETIDNPELILINDYFTEEVSKMIVKKYGHQDIIVANNVYAHIDDIQDTTRAIRGSLKKDGVFVFEVHHLGEIIDGAQYDFIYHEHVFYHSLSSLKNHFALYDMSIFDAKRIPIHGGSIRYYVCKNNSKYIDEESSELESLKLQEAEKRYCEISTFKNFAETCEVLKESLTKLIKDANESNKPVIGYGASGRANTIIQYCDISSHDMDFIIDDNPNKHGYLTPGSHIKILPKESLNEIKEGKCIIIFAWAFADEIMNKLERYLIKGDEIIIPFPEPKVIKID